ncbi:MAG: DUF512 domain-containing protein [Candidatus Eisenbacteria bacterium]
MIALLAGRPSRVDGPSEKRRPKEGGCRPGRKGVRVASVAARSPARRAGIRPGDMITGIDEIPISDFLDFYGAMFGSEHVIEVVRDRTHHYFELTRRKNQDSGVESAPAGLRACNNKCVFCFVDQLPPGLRRELYFKDEDFRLSFLHGNYLTLTNLRLADERRIGEMHLSPLYVSVHATDEDVRARLIGRKPRQPILDILARMGGAGIRFHAQIVVVPGYNDGKSIRSTIEDLLGLGEIILSVSVVPVGLTSHRQGLPMLRPMNEKQARQVVTYVAGLNASMRRKTDRGLVYASDELLILGSFDIPPTTYYDDFPQIENGVGLVRRLLDEIRTLKTPPQLRGKRLAFVTGCLAKPYMEQVASKLGATGLKAEVIAVRNTLLGPGVTVSGLVPGRAIIAALAGWARFDAVVLPPDVVNTGGLTLDDVHPRDIQRILRTPTVVGDYSIKQTLKKVMAHAIA